MTTDNGTAAPPPAPAPKIKSVTSRREIVWQLVPHTAADCTLQIPGDKLGRTLHPDMVEVCETVHDGADAPAPKLRIHVSGRVVNPSTGDLGSRRRIAPPVPLASWLVDLIAKSVAQ